MNAKNKHGGEQLDVDICIVGGVEAELAPVIVYLSDGGLGRL